MAVVDAGAVALVEYAMRFSPLPAAAPDPRLERVLRRVVTTGALLVLAVPVARGANPWLGAMPLWLLGMPLVSWWALHHFRLPRWRQPARADGGMPRRRRRSAAQARRRLPAHGPRWMRAA